MELPACYPYRSEAARDACFAYFDERAARQWPVPSRERVVPTSYGPTFVRISGPEDGQPLVLLPGAAAPSLMWSPNIAELSALYRTFAIDQVGDFGRSLCTKKFGNFAGIVRWLDEVCDGLELGAGINLMGISFGGAVAAEYALQFPRRLRTLVLLAPGAIVLRLRAEFVARLVLAAVTRGRLLPSLFRWMFADAVRKDPGWVEETIEQLLLQMRSLERRAIPNPRVWSDAEWKRLQTPTLFLVGENETIYSAAKAVRRLAPFAPPVTAAIVPGGGRGGEPPGAGVSAIARGAGWWRLTRLLY